METERRPRYEFLDALRGLAAVAVLLTHALNLGAHDLLAALYARVHLGQVGVLVFFLVSGYIVPVSLERARSLAAFWRGRFWRLYPLYAVAVMAALAVGLAGLSRHYLLPAPEVQARPLLIAAANLLPLQQFLGVPSAMEAFWTLSYEVTFYALISLAWLTGMLRRPLWLLALALGIGLLNGSLFHFAYLFLGFVLYRWARGEVRGRDVAGGVALVALVATLTTAPGDRAELVARLLALVVFGIALLVRHASMPRALCWLGRVSYALYLLHVLVLALVPPTVSPLATVALWCLLSLALAAAAERVIERPGIAFGKRPRRLYAWVGVPLNPRSQSATK